LSRAGANILGGKAKHLSGLATQQHTGETRASTF
jgi:hypothetical protein